jgi:phosphatidate phosphatase APP1
VGLTILAILAAPRLAWAKAAYLDSYGGWGSDRGIVVLGRVVEGAPPSGRTHHHRVTKALSTARAFLRGDVEHASVRVTDLQSGAHAEGEADEEGFYDLRLPGPIATGPRALRVELVSKRWRAAPVDETVVVVDASASGVVIVCDIDDTLTATGVPAGDWAVVKATFSKGAGDMRAFPAAAATLAALAEAGAPVVYLSASPVQLAPRLRQFLRQQGFPDGALLLRDDKRDGVRDPGGYKRARIERLLGEWPKRQLVLIGDDGEQDPELFAAVAKASGRVAAAYVRLTVGAAKRAPGIVYFDDWRQVARDAGKKKLVRWMRAQRIATEARP